MTSATRSTGNENKTPSIQTLKSKAPRIVSKLAHQRTPTSSPASGPASNLNTNANGISGSTATTGSTGGNDMTPSIPKLKSNPPRNMSKLTQQTQQATLPAAEPVTDLDTNAKSILGGDKHILQDAMVEKLQEMGIKVKSYDISVASKIVNTETDDLIEKHLVPSTSDRTGEHSTAQHTVDSAIFLESGETIESVESACGPLYSTMVDKGLDGMLPGSKSLGCDKKIVEEAGDTAKGHLRLGNGAAKSDFMFSINAHNHATNVAIQTVLNKLTPQ
jgi:hypothetical protein